MSYPAEARSEIRGFSGPLPPGRGGLADSADSGLPGGLAVVHSGSGRPGELSPLWAAAARPRAGGSGPAWLGGSDWRASRNAGCAESPSAARAAGTAG